MQRMFSHHPLVFEIGKKQKQYSIIRQETIYKFEQCFYIHRVVFSLWEFEFGDETFATKIPSSKSPLIKWSTSNLEMLNETWVFQAWPTYEQRIYTPQF